MRVNVWSCLLVCVLVCNISTEIIHEAVEEKNPATLRCPHPVEGDVTWSRETNGHRVDILTAGGDGDIRHINDPGKRFSSQADKFKSLHIRSVNISDSGRYFCNNEAAVNLTVIPSGTVRLTAAVKTNISLSCPYDVTGSHVPTWIRLNSGTNVTVFSQKEKTEHSPDHIRLQSSAEEPRTLTIRDLQPEDAGLYYCHGKAAAYLTVTEGQQSVGADVLLPAVFLPLLFIISIILFLIWRCSIRRRGSDEQQDEVFYAEISDGSVFESVQGGSNKHDHTYTIIYDLPVLGNKTTTFQPSVPLYSQINKPHHHRENV